MHPEASNRRPSWLGRILLAIGSSGAGFAVLCCFVPFLVAGLVTAIGLGFILKDSILFGSIAVFLGVALVGYYLLRRHRHA
jgi:mercuric ion transport protein